MNRIIDAYIEEICGVTYIEKYCDNIAKYSEKYNEFTAEEKADDLAMISTGRIINKCLNKQIKAELKIFKSYSKSYNYGLKLFNKNTNYAKQYADYCAKQ